MIPGNSTPLSRRAACGDGDALVVARAPGGALCLDVAGVKRRRGAGVPRRVRGTGDGTSSSLSSSSSPSLLGEDEGGRDDDGVRARLCGGRSAARRSRRRVVGVWSTGASGTEAAATADAAGQRGGGTFVDHG